MKVVKRNRSMMAHKPDPYTQGPQELTGDGEVCGAGDGRRDSVVDLAGVGAPVVTPHRRELQHLPHDAPHCATTTTATSTSRSTKDIEIDESFAYYYFTHQ